MLSEEENKLGDWYSREVTFWDQLQGHSQKRGRAAVDQ